MDSTSLLHGGHWHGNMETMKAGGETVSPDHLLPQTPPLCEAARERKLEGMVYWWNTVGGGSHAIPGAEKYLQQLAVPCPSFCWQPDSCTINEKILQLQRATLPTPSEHTGRKLFLSSTGVLLSRSPDICSYDMRWGEPQSDWYTRELLFFSWCGIYLHQNIIINSLQWKEAHWLPAKHPYCLMHFELVFHLALRNYILKVALHFQGTSSSKLWIMYITTFSCKLWSQTSLLYALYIQYFAICSLSQFYSIQPHPTLTKIQNMNVAYDLPVVNILIGSTILLANANNLFLKIPLQNCLGYSLI